MGMEEEQKSLITELYIEVTTEIPSTLPILRSGVSRFLVQSPCLPIFTKISRFFVQFENRGKILEKQLLLSDKYSKWVNKLKENDLNFLPKCIFPSNLTSETFKLHSKCRKCHFRRPNFQNITGRKNEGLESLFNTREGKLYETKMKNKSVDVS